MELTEIKNVLKDKTALIIGCGGLGCYVIEYLSRLDFGNLIICDDDKFSESNMNRQLYCTYNNLGQYKVKVAEKRVKEISEITIAECFTIRLNNDNCDELLKKADLIFDCTDNAQSRLLLSKKCNEFNKVLIHGAVRAANGQISTINPSSDLIEQIYEGKEVERALTFSYVPPFCAAVMVSEAVKKLCKIGSNLDNRLFLFDLFSNNYDIL